MSSALVLRSENRSNEWERAMFSGKANAGSKALVKANVMDAFSVYAPKKQLEDENKILQIRNIFEGASETWEEIKSVIAKMGTEGIAVAAGGTLMKAGQLTSLQATGLTSSMMLGSFAHKSAGKQFSQMDWVVIDNGFQTVTRNVRDALDKDFGKRGSFTHGGFGGDRPANELYVGSGLRRRKQFSFGFYIQDGTEKNTVNVFNFQVFRPQDKKVTDVFPASAALKGRLDSLKQIVEMREEFFNAQGFTTPHNNLIDHNSLLNVEPGSEVIYQASGEMFKVLKSDGDVVKVVGGNGQIKMFNPRNLVNGRVQHRRTYLHKQTWISAGWDDSERIEYQIGSWMWVTARSKIKTLFGKSIQNELTEIKDELTIVRAIVGQRTEFVYVLDCEVQVYKDTDELLRNSSPVDDDEMETVSRKQGLMLLKTAILANEGDFRQYSLINQNQNSPGIVRFGFYPDYRDFGRATKRWQRRLQFRQMGGEEEPIFKVKYLEEDGKVVGSTDAGFGARGLDLMLSQYYLYSSKEVNNVERKDGDRGN